MSQWGITLSRESLKFLDKNHLSEVLVTEVITLAIKKISGENVNVDLKKLHPPYEGCFRVRVGRIRIIFSINFVLFSVEVIEVNWRGSAYRR